MIRPTLVLAILLLAGCSSPPDAPADADPARASTTAPDAPEPIVEATPPSPAPSPPAQPELSIGGPAWSEAAFELSGGANEWIWIWQPFHVARDSYRFTSDIQIRAVGDGQHFAFASDVQSVTRWESDGRLDDTFAFYGASEGMGTVTYRNDHPNTSRSCGGCADIGFYAFMGATAPWTAKVKLAMDGGGDVITQPAFATNGTGVQGWAWTRASNEPADAAATWNEPAPVDAGATFFGFAPASGQVGRGTVEVQVGGWDAQSEFYDALSSARTIGMMGHNGTTATISIERTGLPGDMRLWTVHASGLGVGLGLPAGFGDGRWV